MTADQRDALTLLRPRIVVIGNSHTRPILRAAARHRKQLRNLDLRIHWLRNGATGIKFGDLEVNDAFHLLSELDSNDLVVFSLIGGRHNTVGLLKHPEPFSVFSSHTEESEINGGTFIPYRMMEEYFYLSIESLRVFKDLVDVSKSRTYCLSPPSPKGDIDLSMIARRMFGGVELSSETITDPQLRKCLWTLEQKTIERYCKEVGIGFLFPPAETIDENGFLKPEYFGTDLTHANYDYGKLVIDQLASLLPSEPPEPIRP